MLWISPKRRLPLVIALLVGFIVIGTIVAHARGPAPDAGATYTGTVLVQTPSGALHAKLDLSFAVSPDGHRVTRVAMPDGLPLACPAARVSGVRLGHGSTAIVTPSRFRLALALTRGAPVGRLIISGAFHTFGRESGAMATQFSAAGLRGCGTGAGYSTRAAS